MDTLFYVSTSFGACLRAGRTLKSAEKSALREIGTLSFKEIRYATYRDVEWVRAMGGYVPDGKIYKTKKTSV